MNKYQAVAAARLDYKRLLGTTMEVTEAEGVDGTLPNGQVIPALDLDYPVRVRVLETPDHMVERVMPENRRTGFVDPLYVVEPVEWDARWERYRDCVEFRAYGPTHEYAAVEAPVD